MRISVVFQIFSFAVAVEVATSYEFWNDLRVTWDAIPEESFLRMPRNTVDAAAEGWTLTSKSCTNNETFYGFQWIDLSDDSVALLFDRNGFIAGMQVMVPHKEIINDDFYYPYYKIPMYQNFTMFGQSYFVVTIYFIFPDLICQNRAGGAGKNNIGTFSQVHFQNGISPKYLLHAPKQRANAFARGWMLNSCIPGMGWHNFFKVDRWNNCEEIHPSCLLYNDYDEMHGFCILIPGKAKSRRFEHPTNKMLSAMLGPGKTPQCILDLNKQIGITALHIYLTNSPWLEGGKC